MNDKCKFCGGEMDNTDSIFCTVCGNCVAGILTDISSGAVSEYGTISKKRLLNYYDNFVSWAKHLQNHPNYELAREKIFNWPTSENGNEARHELETRVVNLSNEIDMIKQKPSDYDMVKEGYARATEENKKFKERIEHLEVQLAGCGAAALGWYNGSNLAKPGDYGWSASYQDVLDLRLKYENLIEENKKLNDELINCKKEKDCPEQDKKEFRKIVNAQFNSKESIPNGIAGESVERGAIKWIQHLIKENEQLKKLPFDREKAIFYSSTAIWGQDTRDVTKLATLAVDAIIKNNNLQIDNQSYDAVLQRANKLEKELETVKQQRNDWEKLAGEYRFKAERLSEQVKELDEECEEMYVINNKKLSENLGLQFQLKQYKILVEDLNKKSDFYRNLAYTTANFKYCGLTNY